MDRLMLIVKYLEIGRVEVNVKFNRHHQPMLRRLKVSISSLSTNNLRYLILLLFRVSLGYFFHLHSYFS